MQQALNGTLIVGNEKFALARESDFVDLLKYSPSATLHKIQAALKSTVQGFGELRSPMYDLYRQRLSQLRRHLQQA